jgi:hypothetical protein
MNINDVSKREILDFKQFLGKVMDNNYKPFDPENQKDSFDRTGLHVIKREPAYDWVGYANAIWSPDQAGIIFPGYNDKGNRDYTNMVGLNPGDPNSVFNMDTSESENHDSKGFQILRLEDF